jgi:hypothetical protein
MNDIYAGKMVHVAENCWIPEGNYMCLGTSPTDPKFVLIQFRTFEKTNGTWSIGIDDVVILS